MEATRPATRGDALQCAELCRNALDEVAALRHGTLSLRHEVGLAAKALLKPGGLERLIADRRRLVLMGTIDGVPVGVGLGRIDGEGQRTIGVVDGLYVAQGARGGGVGAALLGGLVDFFEHGGCQGVDVAVLPGDRSTKQFFEAGGFSARLIVMYRPLGGRASSANCPASRGTAQGSAP